MASVHLHSLVPKLFLAHRVWSPHCPILFTFLRFKICDTISNALCDVTWNYDRAVKIKLVARIIFLGASECQETKINKTWNHYQPRSYLTNIRNFTPPVHRSSGILLLVCFLVLPGFVFCIVLQLPCCFWLWLHSTWYQLHEKTWLECHHSDAWNENRIGCWQTTLPSACGKIAWSQD